jgi:hypothetical protein
MKKIIAIVTVAIVSTAAFAGSKGIDIVDIKSKLNLAIYNGDAAAAANWAAALNSLKQAELADEQKKFVEANNNVFRVYGNVVKSAPAVISAVELYNSLQKHPDKELNEAIKVGRILLKLGEGPIGFSELKPIVESIRAREIEAEKRFEDWERNRKIK